MFEHTEIGPLDEEFMLCKVCLQHFDPIGRQPKQLLCCHIFCHVCIDKFLVGGKKGERVTCPLCRETTKYGMEGPAALPTSEHSIKLVSIFRHLLTRDKFKDVNVFHASKIKENKVTSNPLLHPPIKWYSAYWSDDDNGNSMQSSDNEILSPNIKLYMKDLLVALPINLQRSWDKNHGDSKKRTRSLIHDECSFQENGIYTLSASKEDSATFNFQQSFSNGPSSLLDKSEDLDWNYFTETSTLGSVSSRPIMPHREIVLLELTDGVDEHPNNLLNISSSKFSKRDFSPILITASLDGKSMIVVENSKEKKITVFSLQGKELAVLNVSCDVNDACLICCQSYDKEFIVGIATNNGVELIDSNNSETIKSVPIGYVKLLSAFKRGFVAAQDELLVICSDLYPSIIMSSMKYICSNSGKNKTSLDNILDISTCHNPDVIGLLIGGNCFITDESGIVLQKISIDDAPIPETHRQIQMSFSTFCRKVVFIDINSQTVLVHDVPLFTTLNNSYKLTPMKPNTDKILGGTFASESELILIQGKTIWKHLI